MLSLQYPHELGSARRGDTKRIDWTKIHLYKNLTTNPAPTLTEIADDLYVMWGPNQLTPIPTYGDSISYQTKLGSRGDSTKVYICLSGRKAGRWVSIAGLIQTTVPELVVKECHVTDYRLLWSRAETRFQQYTQCELTLFHDDKRIPEMWWGWKADKTNGGEHRANWEYEGRSAERRRRKRRCLERMQLGERVVDCQELDWSEEAEEYMVEHGTRLQIVQPEEEECGEEGLAEMEYTLSDNGSESAFTAKERREKALGATAATELEVDQCESSATEYRWKPRGHRVYLKWTQAEGGLKLELAEAGDQAEEAVSGYMTVNMKGVELAADLKDLKNKCSMCNAGLAATSIDICTKCNKSWWHTVCAPLELSEPGKPMQKCSGCSPIDFWKVHHTALCCECNRLVPDNCCDLVCGTCKKHCHIGCALIVGHVAGQDVKTAATSAATSTLGDERHEQQRRRTHQLGWTCRKCPQAATGLTDGLSPPSKISSEGGEGIGTVTLPVHLSTGPPNVEMDCWFDLKLSTVHLGSIRCRWKRRHIRDIRYDSALRNIEAFLATENPGLQRSLRGIALHGHAQALCLETDARTGNQLLACTIFARTTAAGSILLVIGMGVLNSLRRKGIGRWMLNWAYSFGTESKDMQAMVDGTEEGFLSYMGFVASEKKGRFPMLGSGCLRERKQALGAPLAITLERALYSTRARNQSQSEGLAICSSAEAIAGDSNSCFATAAIQALISIPQVLHLLMRRPGRWETIQHLLSRIVTRVILGSTEGADAEAIALLRERLNPDFGHSATNQRQRPGKVRNAGFGRSQHDIADFMAAIFQHTEEVQDLKHGLQPELGEARSMAELLAWEGVHRRRCAGCGASWAVTDCGAGGELRHGPQEDEVTTVEGLLDPAILEPNVRDSNDLPLRLKGCSCEVPRTNGMFAMTSFPTCLRVEVPRAVYVRATQNGESHCARNVNRVDAPMNLTLCRSGAVVSPNYKLRAVTVATRNASTAAGHFATLKIMKGKAHLCDGMSVKAVELSNLKSLALNEIALCQNFVLTGMYYSAEVEGETETEHVDRNYYTLPDHRESGDASARTERSSCSEEASSDQVEAIPRQRRHGPPPEHESPPELYVKAVKYLESIVPAGETLTLQGADTDPSGGYTLLHASLEAVYSSETPLFVWLHTTAVDWMDCLSEERCLHVHREGTPAGRGRHTDLKRLIDSIASASGRKDPWVSTGAVKGGVGGIRQAREYMQELEAACDGDFILENGLLISQAGAKTDCHMHAGPVIAKLEGAGLQRRNATTGQMETVVQRPCEGTPFPMRKYYVLFDPKTLEKAGICVFDTKVTMPLHMLLHKIRLCSTEQQSQIRWFHGCVDGTTSNAVIWPSTMWHWVLTLSADMEERRLWIGLATQFVPRGAENRARLNETLKCAASTDVTGRPVADLDHLSLQTSSVYFTQLIQQLVESEGANPAHMPSWHQHLSLETAKEQMQLADGQVAAGNHRAAWQTLEGALTSLRETFPLGHEVTVRVAKAQLKVWNVLQPAEETDRTSRSTTHGLRHAGKP